MEPISEDEEEPSPSFCDCLFGSSKKNKIENNDSNADTDRGTSRSVPGAAPPTSTTTPGFSVPPKTSSTRPSLTNRRTKSVYMSAKETLNEEELNALKEFEEAAMAIIGGSQNDESMYFDALEAVMSDNNDTAATSTDKSTTTALPYAPATVAPPHPRASLIMDDPSTLLLNTNTNSKNTNSKNEVLMKELKDPRVKMNLTGYPGELTEMELSACIKFRAQLQERADSGEDGKTYQEIVRVYDPVETEPYSLCRFLRARQFDVPKVFEMIEGSLGVWREARKHNFFPGTYISHTPETVRNGCETKWDMANIFILNNRFVNCC